MAQTSRKETCLLPVPFILASSPAALGGCSQNTNDAITNYLAEPKRPLPREKSHRKLPQWA